MVRNTLYQRIVAITFQAKETIIIIVLFKAIFPVAMHCFDSFTNFFEAKLIYGILNHSVYRYQTVKTGILPKRPRQIQDSLVLFT